MADIGFIGLGNMGGPMAANLAKAGHAVTAFDISAEAIESAREAGASTADTVAETAAGREVVVTMLPAGAEVSEVYRGEGGVLSAAAPGTLLIDCSTIDVDTARAVAATAAEGGWPLLDAPVSGGVAGAAAGTLTFMAGGSAGGFERAEPILGAMGRNVIHVGGPGHGQGTKICNNMMVGIAMIGASEVFCLGEALGIDPKTLYDVISTSTGQTWIMDHMHPVPGIVESSAANRNYAPGFKAALMAKDLGLAQSAAADSGASIPLGSAAASLFRMLCHNGAGELDLSAVYKLLHGDL